MGTERIRQHIIFRGDVQGVGFRYRASQFARSLDITGWVRNNYDGSVEMEVQGLEEAIDMLVNKLYMSPYIRIDRMDATQIPLREEDRGFYVEDYY